MGNFNNNKCSDDCFCAPYAHYLDPRNTFWGTFLCGVILALVIGCVFEMFAPKFMEVYWTAAFGIVGYTLSNFIRARIRRYNCLCRLEVDLVHAQGILNDMKYVISGVIASGLPVIQNIDQLSLTVDDIKGVGRIDVKNLLEQLATNFRKINRDISVVEKLPLSVNVPSGEAMARMIHSANIKNGIDTLKQILKYIVSTEVELIQCLSLIRIYLKSDKPFFRTGQPYVSKQKIDRLLPLEMERLKREVGN